MRIPLLITVFLAACGGGSATPPVVPLETQTFAPALGVDLASSTRTANGVYFRDAVKGAGDPVVAGDTLTVDYTGSLPDGTRFDAGPLQFLLGNHDVIAGWDEGLPGAQAGTTRQLVIPSALAYGPAGRGRIPPNANLIFSVVVHSFAGPVPIEKDTFNAALMVNLAASNKTANGVYVQDIAVGTGPVAASGQMVTVDYSGYLANGTRFDASQTPVTFKLGAGQTSVAGLDEGLIGVRLGGKRKLVIPSALAYGAFGRGSVPPYANLVFDVTVHQGP